MEPFTLASAYATIVGLIGTFASGRGQRQSLDMGEFLEWLVAHGHNEIKAAIESNHATAISIKASLSEGRSELLARLDAIDTSLATLSLGQGPFEALAASLRPNANLSTQAIDILVAFEEAQAGAAIEHTAYDGVTLIFTDGIGNSSFAPSEARFYDSDVDALVSSGLILLSYSEKGNRIFRFTRAASELAAIVAKRRVDEHQS